MENNEIKTLIEAFRGYRELLNPIQQNLHDFAGTYHSLREDIQKLNIAFEGDIEGNLEKIYQNLSKQAEQATDLSSRIDNFVRMTDEYTKNVTKLTEIIEQATLRMHAIGEIESKAEQQLGKLSEVLEEKRKNYNIRELQKTMDAYNANVQRMSEFINKDVVEAVTESNKKLDSIKYGSDSIAKRIEEDGTKLGELLLNYKSSNDLLKKIVEKGDVDEAYIYNLLDNWAKERKIRIKK